MNMFFALLIGHALADYPLQGEFLAKAKNRSMPIPGVPWYHALFAHSAIHAGVVWVVTGVWWLGALEFFAHALIDDAKCTGKLNFDADQTLHLVCKAIWAYLALKGVAA